MRRRRTEQVILDKRSGHLQLSGRAPIGTRGSAVHCLSPKRSPGRRAGCPQGRSPVPAARLLTPCPDHPARCLRLAQCHSAHRKIEFMEAVARQPNLDRLNAEAVCDHMPPSQ
jgi:hypothetical protein